MAVYDAAHRPDYWKLQVTTTRNVTQDSLGFVHWFCGGLDYQVEHHLFPTMPRHHLAECNRRVRKFCKDYGVTYHETTMWQGTLEVLEHLQDIANEVIEDFPAMWVSSPLPPARKLGDRSLGDGVFAGSVDGRCVARICQLMGTSTGASPAPAGGCA